MFSQGLKKSSLELYGLICYGELRKKIGGCEYELFQMTGNYFYTVESKVSALEVRHVWYSFTFVLLKILCSLYSTAVNCTSPLFLCRISLAFTVCEMQLMWHPQMTGQSICSLDYLSVLLHLSSICTPKCFCLHCQSLGWHLSPVQSLFSNNEHWRWKRHYGLLQTLAFLASRNALGPSC